MTPTRLAFDVTGDGPLAVVIHGITEDRRSWDPVPLAKKFTVLRVDMRGHGESPVEGPYDLLTLGADVHDVVEREFPGSRPLVIGHSMGGVVATSYAHQFPVLGVVNVDQPLRLGSLQDAVVAERERLTGDGFAGFMSDLFASMYGDLGAEQIARLESIRDPRQEVVLGMWQVMLGQGPDELEDEVDALCVLPDGTPYLSLHGIDPGPDYSLWLRHRIPSIELELWPSGGHYPHLAEPELFVRRMMLFARTATER